MAAAGSRLRLVALAAEGSRRPFTSGSIHLRLVSLSFLLSSPFPGKHKGEGPYRTTLPVCLLGSQGVTHRTTHFPQQDHSGTGGAGVGSAMG